MKFVLSKKKCDSIFYLSSCVVGCLVLFALPGDVLAGRASLTIAQCENAPTIDGKIDIVEWADAAVISNFINSDSVTTSNPNTVVYVMADGKNLYIAARCPEPSANGPQGFVREHDDRAFEDDSIQVYLAPEDMRTVKKAAMRFGGYEGSYNNWYTDIKAYYEFTVNCEGSTTEAWNDVRTWNAPWTVKVFKGRSSWTMEMIIPFSSIGIKAFPDNAIWGFNVFRNRQAKKSGWVNRHYGGYTPLPIGAMLITRDHPVVRQQMVSPPKLGKNKLKFTLKNLSDNRKNFKIVVGKVSRLITLAPGKSKNVIQPYTLKGEGNIRVAYDVKVEGENIPMLSGQVGMRVPIRTQRLSLMYYSVPAELYGNVIRPNSQAARAVLSLKVANKNAGSKEVRLSGSKGQTIKIPVPGKPGDEISGLLQIFSRKGKLLAEKKINSIIPPKYSWIGTKAGLPLGVLPPYTPITVSGKSIKMLGKTLEYVDFALPAKVITAGEEILAAPMSMVVKSNGKEVTWESRKWSILEQDDLHVKIQSDWSNKNFNLKVTSNIEYDGFCWNEAVLVPYGNQKVDGISLNIPFKKDVCKYIYRGHAQKGNALSPVGMRGQIVDNMWVGDERRGIAWIAEGLEWLKSSDYGNQVSIIPGKNETVWRSTFLDDPTVFRKPYKMEFALQITPAKPISLKKNKLYQYIPQWEIHTKPAGSLLIIPVTMGKLDMSEGTIECWVKPMFNSDTKAKVNLLNIYNPFSTSLGIFSNSHGRVDLYYSGKTKNFVLEVKKTLNSTPVKLIVPGKLPFGQWSYVKISWGDKLRLNVNGQVSDAVLKGLIDGGISQHSMNFNTWSFPVDELHISKNQRTIDVVPNEGFSADGDTLVLFRGENLQPEKMAAPGKLPQLYSCKLVPGKFGKAIGPDKSPTRLDIIARGGTKEVGFFETWTPYQGYPYLGNVDKVKSVADACHAGNMKFVLYFSQHVSDASPVWKGMEWDFTQGEPFTLTYRRSDVKQNCYNSCGNGPFADLILDGIEKLAEQGDIDGVYMDGTTVPWWCSNPTHPGCGVSSGDGTYVAHRPIRGVRTFMKRLRNIFVQRGKDVSMGAHTGGELHIGTISFCDYYYEGETLHRYKSGYHLSPEAFVAGYMAKQFGVRGVMLYGPRTPYDKALSISLIHDIAVQNQPSGVDNAWADYQDDQTTYLPYWDNSALYKVSPREVLASVYLKKNKALLVFGSHADKKSECVVDVAGLLEKLPVNTCVYDAITGNKLKMADGKFSFVILPLQWRMVELRPGNSDK